MKKRIGSSRSSEGETVLCLTPGGLLVILTASLQSLDTSSDGFLLVCLYIFSYFKKKKSLGSPKTKDDFILRSLTNYNRKYPIFQKKSNFEAPSGHGLLDTILTHYSILLVIVFSPLHPLPTQ